MKIPENTNLSSSDMDVIYELWETTARQVSMTYGILVTVKHERSGWQEPITRIYFAVDDHEFESLLTLKRALRMKAFL